MSFLNWIVRCVPGLSVLVLLILVECSLQIVQTEYISLRYPIDLVQKSNPVFAEFMFITYSALLHVFALVFPLRLCWSAWRAATLIETVHSARHNHGLPRRKETQRDLVLGDYLDSKSDNLESHKRTIQAIMIPSYQEDVAVLEDTLKVLASHKLASTSYDVCGENEREQAV